MIPLLFLYLPLSILSSQPIKIGTYSIEKDIWKFGSSSPIFLFIEKQHYLNPGGDIYINIGDHRNPHLRENDYQSLSDFTITFLSKYAHLDYCRLFFTFKDSREGQTNVDITMIEGFLYSMKKFLIKYPEILYKVSHRLSKNGRIESSLGVSINANGVFTGPHSITQIVDKFHYDFNHKLSIGWVIRNDQYSLPKMNVDLMKNFDNVLLFNYRNNNDQLLRNLKEFLQNKLPGASDDSIRRDFRAKISLLFQSSCDVDRQCGLLSFCAYGVKGFDYIRAMANEVHRGIRNTLPQVYRDIFEPNVNVNDFYWYQCFFPQIHFPSGPQCVELPLRMEECRQK